MAGSDRGPDPHDSQRAQVGKAQTFYESEMALFYECIQKCARKLLDTADIVRDGISTESAERGSVGVGQHNTGFAQQQPLLFGDDQKLESAAQTVAITHHGSHLDDVRRDGNGKLQGNNFANLQLAAEGRAAAIHTELAGSAPVAGRLAFTKHRHLNARIETTPGETPQPAVSFGCRLFVLVQFSLSISDIFTHPSKPYF